MLSFTLFNVYLLLWIVPKFQQIFADALPGKPLPPVTEFILDWRVGILMLDVTMAILCLVLAWKKWRHAGRMIGVSTVMNFAQAVITIVALFLPIIGMTFGVTHVACN